MFYVLELQLHFAICRQEVENKVVETEPENISLPADDTSAMKYVSLFFLYILFCMTNSDSVPRKLITRTIEQPEKLDWDEFGNDLYSIPDQLPVQSSYMILEAPPTNNADEDSKIKALIDTPALDWQQ